MAKNRIRYRYGGKKGKQRTLYDNDALLVVRTTSRRPLARSATSKEARALLGSFEPVVQFAEAGVEVFRARPAATGRGRSGPRALRDKARRLLSKSADVAFAGRVLTERGSGIPVLYTENIFVKFKDDTSAAAAKRKLKAANLAIKRELTYARGAWFVEGPSGIGREIFTIAADLLEDPAVELCHPELVRPRVRRVAAPQQWHLHKTRIGSRTIDQHANVAAAWSLSEGEGATIAIIDDGVDVDHLEFAGAGKVVHPPGRDTRGEQRPAVLL